MPFSSRKPMRRASDFPPGYRPLTGESTAPADFDAIRANIPCQWACPARTDVPGYIKAIHDHDLARAYLINRKANLFPGILGRVCSRPCEDACRHGDPDLGQPVGICSLKRVAADHAPAGFQATETMFSRSGKSVAIVGGGPAGLAAAHHLALFGHRIVLFEAMPKLGGMLRYGIPRFRIPEALVEAEIDAILRLGVQARCDCRLGRDIELNGLLSSHDAVILALGCLAEKRLGIEGEDLAGVHSGLGFMMRHNQGDPLPVGRRVAVIGGGFTAMDCARTALRLGAVEVVNYIRRTEEELPVSREEIHEAKKEGVRLANLVSPVALRGEDGQVREIVFRRNRLVGSGQRLEKRPLPIEGSDFMREADTVIVAIGQGPDRGEVWPQSAPHFAEDGSCEIPGLYLAGDFHGGASTVIEAIGHAQRVAIACDAHLTGHPRRHWVVTCEVAGDTERRRSWDFLPRQEMPALEVAERFRHPSAEVEQGYGDTASQNEAQRCYLCNLRYTIHVPDCISCRWCIDLCPRNCIHLAAEVLPGDGHLGIERIVKATSWRETTAIVIDNDRCIRCGECLRVCPTQCIHVTRIGLAEKLVAIHETRHD